MKLHWLAMAALLLTFPTEGDAQGQPPVPPLCNIVPRADLQVLTGRVVTGVRYGEPRAGGKFCTYAIQIKPSEVGVTYMELFVRHLVHESAEAALRFGTSSLNCDYRDGGLFPVEVARANAYTCFSYATGDRNNGVQVVVVRDRREIEIGLVFFGGQASSTSVDIPGLSKAMVKPLVELGMRVLDRWDGR